MSGSRKTPAEMAAGALCRTTSEAARAQGLAVVRDGRAALSQALTVSEAQAVRAKAEALRVYLRLQEIEVVGDVLVEVSALSVEASRRIGQLLPDQNPGVKPDADSDLVRARTRYSPTTISRYRALASIPDREWRVALETAKAERIEVSGSALLKMFAPAEPKPDPKPIPAAEPTGTPEPLPPAAAPPKRREPEKPKRVTLTTRALAAYDACREAVGALAFEDGQATPAMNDAGRALPSAFVRAYAESGPHFERARAVWAQAAEAEAEDVRLGARRDA